ncbi:hypothetical protein ALC56_08463, partial [Trachymyrmex septentrionalis]
SCAQTQYVGSTRSVNAKRNKAYKEEMILIYKKKKRNVTDESIISRCVKNPSRSFPGFRFDRKRGLDDDDDDDDDDDYCKTYNTRDNLQVFRRC